MLTKEQCKPGTEVIAIRNIPDPDCPPLSIGMIYTIQDTSDWVKDMQGNREDRFSLSLHEIEPVLDEPGFSWAYFPEQFKLRDPNEFIKLFRLNEIKIKEDA